ncbi:hypothetical protein ATCV1_z443R [Acanthocystis turfacea chlorella virus 1]|uniref:Uncharacterized protein z443R n=1 Tax=Chlorovirus heliozoae TaxID=322019 RepID=A7K953_9PHYC|nr:hypothetical protein ATCV1_z443R [Acanthocystis turfacea chlorella virus 1]ABT16577.1 hypothetical protein ATCV1_z443R [Acanthocystis turfacea chlorella virus 1]
MWRHRMMNTDASHDPFALTHLSHAGTTFFRTKPFSGYSLSTLDTLKLRGSSPQYKHGRSVMLISSSALSSIGTIDFCALRTDWL